VGKKILVVDDSSTIRKLVGIALVQGGYEVVEACDGVDGVEKLNANADLAMVICDVNMPRLSGIEMLSQIAKLRVGPMIPILMLTTEQQPNLIARAREAGAKGWLIKPFKPEVLLGAVSKLLAQ